MSKDPFLDKIIRSVKNDSGHAFAMARDSEGKLHHLAAETEELIEKYCEGSLLREELAIEEWASWVTPAVVAKDFKWVGESRNPYSISKPIYKYDSEGNFVGYREFKEKF